MQRKIVPKVELKLLSQDPRQFCMNITTKVQQDIDPSFLENLDLHRIRRFFFVGFGWRLTRSGFELLTDHYISYTSSNQNNKLVTGKIILNMDHCVGGPWFLRHDSITVFNSISHFELGMVNGCINQFIDFKISG